jgi:hypothetical protein
MDGAQASAGDAPAKPRVLLLFDINGEPHCSRAQQRLQAHAELLHASGTGGS